MKVTCDIEIRSPLECPLKYGMCCKLGPSTYMECNSDTEFPQNCSMKNFVKKERTVIDEYTNLKLARCCLSCKFSYNRQPYGDSMRISCILNKGSNSYTHIYDVCENYSEDTDIENKWEE